LTGWRSPVFDRRYEMTVVTDEDAAQIERLRYVLGQADLKGAPRSVGGRNWQRSPGPKGIGAASEGNPDQGMQKLM
jgi:hypothetical protein